MKISRDRLKQIIKEELQSLALAEVKHTASDEEEEVAPALARDRKQRGVDAAGNPIALPVDDAKALDAASREAIKQNAGADVSPFDPRDDLPSKYGRSDQFTGPGEWPTVRDPQTQLGTADPLQTPVDAIGSTGFGAADVDMDALRAREKRAKRPAGKKRVASKGKLTGRSINAKWRAGEFGPYEGGKKGTKSRANWLRVRRALANRGQDDAQVALNSVSARVHGVDAAGNLTAKAAQVAGVPKVASKTRAVAKAPKGTPLFNPKNPELAAQAGSEAKPTGLASVGVKKPDTAVAKAPTKKATRKRTLAQMNQTELDGVRRELAAGDVPTDEDARRTYNSQVRKRVAKLRKERPNLSDFQRREIAKVEARKDVLRAAGRMIARKNKRERKQARTNMMTGVDLE
jgi:hypothetical protein